MEQPCPQDIVPQSPYGPSCHPHLGSTLAFYLSEFSDEILLRMEEVRSL